MELNFLMILTFISVGYWIYVSLTYSISVARLNYYFNRTPAQFKLLFLKDKETSKSDKLNNYAFWCIIISITPAIVDIYLLSIPLLIITFLANRLLVDIVKTMNNENTLVFKNLINNFKRK